MRAIRVAACLVITLGCTSAFATEPDDVWSSYWRALNHICPTKHLDLLSPADLRDVLDDFKSHAGATMRSKMEHAEKHRCKNSIAGAGCFNLGDIEVAEKHDALIPIATTVCDHFAVCRDQSDCGLASTYKR